MKKSTVTVGNGKEKGEFRQDTLLVDALGSMGTLIPTPCGGKGRCGKCRVKVDGDLSDLSAAEKELGLEGTGYRLSCQARCAGNVDVGIEADTLSSGQKTAVLDPGRDYAAAVDIGTTSVKMSLVDLQGMEAYPIESFLNPQRRYGDDVISRISASRDRETHTWMVKEIRDSVFTSLARFCDESSVPPERVVRMVLSGNTVMLSLFFGLDISGMGEYPFPAPSLDFDDSGSLATGGGTFAHVRFHAVPALSSFIGGDLMGGLACMYEQGFRKNIFFIDMGTNGEIFVINSSGEIYATSCAMGPALEGMNISSGMTAGPGAITRVWNNGGRLAYGMIGKGSPKGLAGTAVIDSIALLLDLGVITENGSFSVEAAKERLPEQAHFRDGAPREVAFWDIVSLTQKDIRNVQLAKGASLAASTIILKEAGMEAKEIDEVLIAGAFGEHLNMESFKRLMFIPEFPSATVHFMGNSSLQAAEVSCRDPRSIKGIKDFRDRTGEIELSMDPGFNTLFIDSLNFPGPD
jgi:uncharacterized 2Fe-2S/4Fe-4S cluster protein (DUF4445 family)